MDYQTPQDPFVSRGMSVVQPRRRRPRLLLVTLLGLGLAAGIITLAVVIPRLIESRTQPVSGASTDGPSEIQIECANIKHAYANWSGGLSALTKLPHQSNLVASIAAQNLVEQAEAFKAAVNGYKDKPSKDLYAVVLQYRFDVGLVDLQLRGGGTTDAELHSKALESWQKADSSYSAFLALTCS